MFLAAQIAVTAPTNLSTFFQNFNQAILIVLVIASFVLAGFGLLMITIRLILRKNTYLPPAFQKIILVITVPKEGSDLADHEETIQKIKEQISFTESWLSTLGGLKAQRGVRTWFWGRSDQFSFEIVTHKNKVSFYVAVPQYLRQYMEQQLLAQYPEASINQIEDYNIFSPTGSVLTGYLKFTRSFILPIKTYNELSSDPLNSLTNSLSGLNADEGIAIQIVARSAKKVWHRKGSKVAREMQKGKSFEQALAETKIINWNKIFSQAAPQKDKDKSSKEDPRSLSPMEQTLVENVEKKTSKAGLDCNIRIIVSARDKVAAQTYLDRVVSSFSQLNSYEYGNSFKFVKESPNKLITDFIYRRYQESQKVILNAEELATVYHLPTPFLDTPNIDWLLAKKLPPANNLPSEGLLLGENIYRGIKTNVYLATEDRRRHQYIIGMTGTGKSALLTNLITQDIRDGKGVCVIDPHGSLAEDVLKNVPQERIDEVIYFNPADINRPVGLNILEAKTPEEQDFAIQEMISIFYKLVTDPSMIGPMFEHNMRNAMLTLMADQEHPGTIAEIPRMFTDPEFQKYKVAKVTDPMVRSFWEKEMAKTSDFHKSEMLGYLISKVGRFIENAMIRNIVGQPQSGFNFRKIMDEGKILIVNLSKGQVGEVNSNLLGLIIVSKLQMAALTRTDIAENQRKDFYLYIDEFQNFITDSVATILAEARKYKLNLILAHQYIGQLTEGSGPEGKSQGNKIRDAIFGNVGTLVSFRIGVDDAEFIAKQMAPVVDEYDLINIEKFNAYVRLLVDNQPLKAFNIRTFPPPIGDQAIAQSIIDFSRWKYGTDRQKIEGEILKRSNLGSIKINQPMEKTL